MQRDLAQSLFRLAIQRRRLRRARLQKVASRYGTNDDLIALFDAAHRRDMHVILDLVPGHTSEEHEWFHRSCKVERNNYSDRYIWTDSWISGGDGLPFIGGESPATVPTS